MRPDPRLAPDNNAINETSVEETHAGTGADKPTR
jgi:hypothetical protein